MTNETLIPKIGVITDVRQDTPDIKTFRVVSPEGKNQKDHGKASPEGASEGFLRRRQDAGALR